MLCEGLWSSGGWRGRRGGSGNGLDSGQGRFSASQAILGPLPLPLKFNLTLELLKGGNKGLFWYLNTCTWCECVQGLKTVGWVFYPQKVPLKCWVVRSHGRSLLSPQTPPRHVRVGAKEPEMMIRENSFEKNDPHLFLLLLF